AQRLRCLESRRDALERVAAVARVALEHDVRHPRLREPRTQYAVRDERVIEPDLGLHVTVVRVQARERIDYGARGLARDRLAELAAVRAEQTRRIVDGGAVDHH